MAARDAGQTVGETVPTAVPIAREFGIPAGRGDNEPWLVAEVPPSVCPVLLTLFHTGADWASLCLVNPSPGAANIPFEIAPNLPFDPALIHALNLVYRQASFGKFIRDSIGLVSSSTRGARPSALKRSRIRQFISCSFIRAHLEHGLASNVVGPVLHHIRTDTREQRVRFPSAFDEVLAEMKTLLGAGSFGDPRLTAEHRRGILKSGRAPCPEVLAHRLFDRLDQVAKQLARKLRDRPLDWTALQAACVREAYATHERRKQLPPSTRTASSNAAAEPGQLPGLAVVLRGPAERPIVFGTPVPPLQRTQFQLVKKLVDACGDGVKKGELDVVNGDALKVLRRLMNDHPDTWGRAIVFPGGKGRGGYRISQNVPVARRS